VPGQSDPRGAVEWTDLRLQGGDGLAARAAKKLRTEEMLLTQLGGSRLRHELDKVPLRAANMTPAEILLPTASRSSMPASAGCTSGNFWRPAISSRPRSLVSATA
jgi:hypothetical protein